MPSTEVTAEEIPDGDALEVIMVSAQKRTERAQDVPVSVTSVDGEDLSYFQGSGQDIRVLSGRAPSLILESSFGRVFPRAYIRGLGNTDFDLNASQPVSIILDDVVLENSITKAFPLFDIDQVEVLRGPQGTLFGRNTPAGIIKLSSRRPDYDDPSTMARLTFGSFNFTEAEVASNATLIDQKLALRASALYRRRSGWVTNANPFLDDAPDLGGYEQLAGRLQLLYTPSSNFESLLTVKGHTLSSNTSRVFRANIIEPGTEDFVDGFSRDEVFHDGISDQELDQWGTSLKLTYDAGEFSVVSITAYEVIEDFTSRGDIDGGYGAAFLDDPDLVEDPPVSGPGLIPFTAESADAIPGLYQFTQELRILSNDWDVLNYQAGLFFFREDFNIQSLNFDTLTPGNPLNGFATQSQVNRAVGAFASATLDLHEKLRIGGGLRYTNDVKDYSARRDISPLSFLGVGPLARQSVDTGDNEELQKSYLSWDFTVRVQPTREITLFTRAATAFRAPTIQGQLLIVQSVDVAGE
ncbi:MAG: TonB-dependent receptor, partial [Myxococcota bacterium]